MKMIQFALAWLTLAAATVVVTGQAPSPAFYGTATSINAANVQPGTFPVGNYVFSDNVTADNFISDTGTAGQGFFFGAITGAGLLYDVSNFDRPGGAMRGGATTRSAPLSFALPTRAETTGQTLNELKGGILFYSNDADGQPFILPNDPIDIGIVWMFLVRQTQTTNSLSIAPSAGETLRLNNANCSTLTSTVRDSYAEVMTSTTGAGGNFTVLHNQGTWTCNP